MYITNHPEVAKIAEEAGVDWIFVDLEFIGKAERQHSDNAVRNHSISDVRIIKESTSKSNVIARINPLHDALPNYPSSKDEIDEVINAGADIIMLPYFHTLIEIQTFLNIVEGRAKTCLLLETIEAANILDQIVEIPGIDMIHIGINDMHIDLGKKFMFELLSNGLVEKWINTIQNKGIMCGFGGIANIDSGVVPGGKILLEHIRLKSEMVIVSRTFCDIDKISNLATIKQLFDTEIKRIRDMEEKFSNCDNGILLDNHKEVIQIVDEFISHDPKLIS